MWTFKSDRVATSAFARMSKNICAIANPVQVIASSLHMLAVATVNTTDSSDSHSTDPFKVATATAPSDFLTPVAVSEPLSPSLGGDGAMGLPSHIFIVTQPNFIVQLCGCVVYQQQNRFSAFAILIISYGTYSLIFQRP
jgi:hypothetical protein